MKNPMKNLKYFVPSFVVLGVLALAATAYANPFYAGQNAKTALATSTQAFLTPGTATTTPVYDSYETYGTNQTNSGNLTLPDTVAVVLNGAASSTASVVNIACEYSDNYNGTTGNGDWYQNEVLAPTSTGALVITNPVTFTFTYASSTVGGALVGANTNRFGKVFTCPMPLRFVRAVVTSSGAPSSVWAAIEPVKQRN